jgi:hypothetical protein
VKWDVEVTPSWAAQQVVHGHQDLGVSGASGSMHTCVVDAAAVSYLMYAMQTCQISSVEGGITSKPIGWLVVTSFR